MFNIYHFLSIRSFLVSCTIDVPEKKHTIFYNQFQRAPVVMLSYLLQFYSSWKTFKGWGRGTGHLRIQYAIK